MNNFDRMDSLKPTELSLTDNLYSITVEYFCRSQFSAVYRIIASIYILNNTHCFWLFPPGLYYCENNLESCLAHLQYFFLLAALLYAKNCIIAFFNSTVKQGYLFHLHLCRILKSREFIHSS
jgi:hypothetical protein